MNAIAEQAGKDDAASFGKLGGQLCPKHGLHFNPLLAHGCGCCTEEEERHTQARIALWIVAAVLLAMLTVMAKVTWHWYSGGTALANSSTIVQSVE